MFYIVYGLADAVLAGRVVYLGFTQRGVCTKWPCLEACHQKKNSIDYTPAYDGSIF